MNKKVITRFAPSPTGYLHVGNVRTALINYLYAKKFDGKFILRMDDTDFERSKEEYKQAIIKDLSWLGFVWDESFNQLSRMDRYLEAKKNLLSDARLYPCYETPEELDVKRKIQLSRGLPPIYDRASLSLSSNEIAEYEKNGRKPHYRFKINDGDIIWHDMIKGDIRYNGVHLGDPVIIRADGSMTYMICSTVDDIDYGITHVIRGEDHVSNTAIQIQMFEALRGKAPEFGHLSLVKSKDDKISKREGGFDIASLRDKEHIEAMAVNSFFSLIGSSNNVKPCKNIEELAEIFDIAKYSKSPTTFMPEELELINHKLLIMIEYGEIKDRLSEIGSSQINEEFWLAVRPNLKKLTDIAQWWEICFNPTLLKDQDYEFLAIAAKHLPQEITLDSWTIWTENISNDTGRKGKNLFMPLRIALTGKTSGPELKALLPILSRDEILRRLEG